MIHPAVSLKLAVALQCAAIPRCTSAAIQAKLSFARSNAKMRQPKLEGRSPGWHQLQLDVAWFDFDRHGNPCAICR
jgi:hypothetical protein